MKFYWARIKVDLYYPFRHGRYGTVRFRQTLLWVIRCGCLWFYLYTAPRSVTTRYASDIRRPIFSKRMFWLKRYVTEVVGTWLNGRLLSYDMHLVQAESETMTTIYERYIILTPVGPKFFGSTPRSISLPEQQTGRYLCHWTTFLQSTRFSKISGSRTSIVSETPITKTRVIEAPLYVTLQRWKVRMQSFQFRSL